MKEVLLLNSTQTAKVDDSDHDLVSQYEWSFRKGKRQNYAYGRKPGTQDWVAMHVLLMNPGPGQEVDHVNSEGLDNQRHNLRNTSKSQNQANRRASLKSYHGLKGVSRNKACDRRFRFRVAVTKNLKTYRLGSYPNSKKAALIYDAAAKLLFGEHARLNYPAQDSVRYAVEVARMLDQVEKEGRAVPTRRRRAA